MPCPSLCPSSHGTIGIRALGPQKFPAEEYLKLMLVGEVSPNVQTLAKLELGVCILVQTLKYSLEKTELLFFHLSVNV